MRANEVRAARNEAEWKAHGVAADVANRAIRSGKRGVRHLIYVKIQDAYWARLAKKR